MASPAELVQTVSSLTGVALPTVVDIDRKLVKAGLRTKGGRGFNAARMSPLDAARLLTAVLAGPQATEAADAVERYSNTHADKTCSSEKLFATAKLADLGTLPDPHSFVDALAALISSASTGALAELVASEEMPSIEVFAFTRAVRGRIRIAGLPDGLTASVEYCPAPATPRSSRHKRRPVRDAPEDERIGDLEQSRRITERTIWPIARLLAKG